MPTHADHFRRTTHARVSASGPRVPYRVMGTHSGEVVGMSVARVDRSPYGGVGIGWWIDREAACMNSR